MLGGSWTGSPYAGQAEQQKEKIGMKEYTALCNNKQQRIKIKVNKNKNDEIMFLMINLKTKAGRKKAQNLVKM